MRLVLGFVVAGLLLAGAEMLLRVVLGPPSPPVRVYSVVQGLRQRLVEDDGQVTAAYQIYRPYSPFPAHVDAPRIGVLGGSCVHGGSMNVGNRKEFPALLRPLLGVSSVNLGAPGLDSHDIRAIVEELVAFNFTWLVVYTGHNDFGNTTYHHRYQTAQGVLAARMLPLLERSWIFCQLRRALAAPPRVPALEKEDKPTLEPLVGVRRQTILRHYAINLRRISWVCQQAGIGLVWVVPVDNLTSAPANPECLFEPCARRLWEQATALSAAGGDRAQVLDLLIQARDADVPTVLAPTELHDFVRALAAENGDLLVDPWLALPQDARIPAPATDLFADKMHFSAKGHAAMAQAIAQVLSSQGNLQGQEQAPRRPAP